MWLRHVVILMCAAAAPLGEYGLEDPTAASGVQPIVQFLMAGEGYQKRGEAHFVVRRLRAVRALADDDFAMAWDLRSGTETLWRATWPARGLFDVPEAKAHDKVHTSFTLPALNLSAGCYELRLGLVRRVPLSAVAARRGYVGGDPQACGRAPPFVVRHDGIYPSAPAAALAGAARRAFDAAYAESCDLSAAVLTVPGMARPGLRHFLCALGDDDAWPYLEVGVFKGASLSAFANGRRRRAAGIDNWVQFQKDNPESKQTATAAVEAHAPGAELVDADAWALDTPARAAVAGGVDAFHIYFYDGGHDPEEHYAALPHYLPVLARTFLFVVDDWGWPGAAAATWDAIRHCDLEVEWFHETAPPLPFDHRDETGAVEAFNGKWNNGMAAFVLTQRRRAYGIDAAVRDVEVEYA